MLGVRLLGNSKVCIDEFPEPKPEDDDVLVKVILLWE
jgi:NADPH:quinone reductase-like Zn-dependent oxidoreductase